MNLNKTSLEKMNLKKLSPSEFGKILTLALNIDFPYPDRLRKLLLVDSTDSVVPAAVLVLIGYSEKKQNGTSESDPSVLFIRRTESVETHKGQMAFPGGQCDPEDDGGVVRTALRETTEEVGISPENVEVFGMLPTLITTSSFSIQPVVGTLKKPIEQVPLTLNKAEVEEAIWIPLQQLSHPDTYRQEFFTVGQGQLSAQFPIDVYQVMHHRIWGATGSITKNLLDRLDAALKFSSRFRNQNRPKESEQ